MIRRSLRSLHFAVRIGALAKHLGQMFLILAVLMTVPLAVALATGQQAVALRYALLIGGIVPIGLLAARLPFTGRLQKNEAFVISALVFVLPPLLLAVPLQAYGLTYVDALFEAVSGVTTTGLSALATVESRPAGFLFARAWMQWVGGYGVVVLALALLLEPGTASNHLGFDRRETDDVVGGTRSHARKVLLVYIVLTVLGTAMLWLLGAKPFDALVHTMTALSTGGFANYDDSLAQFNKGPLGAVTMVICLAGAISFYSFYSGYYGKWRPLVRDPQLLGLLAATLVTTGLLYLFMTPDLAPTDRLRHAAFTAISAQTTAGFSSMPLAELAPAAKGSLIISMLIGGGLGSTAGGIKILRLLVLLKILQLFILRASLAEGARFQPRIGGQRLSPREIEASLAVVMGYLLTLGASWLVFLAYGLDPLDSLFEVASAVGTVGLSVGVTAPDLAVPLKLLLCFDMLMGRVETLALLVVLFPGTWIGKRRSST